VWLVLAIQKYKELHFKINCYDFFLEKANASLAHDSNIQFLKVKTSTVIMAGHLNYQCQP
jgi:hypothetical protein